MCYSAMVQQHAKKLGLKFEARVQTELYLNLFERRMTGEKIMLNKAMERQFTIDAESREEERIGKLIEDWHFKKASECEAELFKQKTRLADAERTLKTKVTKKAENDLRIAGGKIKKLLLEIERHKTKDIIWEPEQSIFPGHYFSIVCLDEQGRKVVRPVRYLMRPHDKKESFDREFGGCYNARLDSLERVAWWKNVFGKNHGLMIVSKFYENVASKDYAKSFALDEKTKGGESLILCFEPQNGKNMLIPVLWDKWESKGEPTLFSAALITDEPEPEIARAGHDRTPIFLREDVVDEWLHPQGKSPTELMKILATREHPGYSHKVVGAA